MRQAVLHLLGPVILPLCQGVAFVAFLLIYFQLNLPTDEAGLIAAAASAGLVSGLVPTPFAVRLLRTKPGLSGDDLLSSILLGQLAWVVLLLFGWVGWAILLFGAIPCAVGTLVGGVIGLIWTRRRQLGVPTP
jgi:hypothetical protein